MRQRILRGLKEQGQGLSTGFEYVMMMDGGAATSSSKGAMGAQEARARSSPGGAAGASRPPIIRRVGVDGVASVREGQVKLKPHQHDTGQ